MKLNNVVVVDFLRSPFARGGKGLLTATRMDEVAGKVVRALLERNPKVDPYGIEDMACGTVFNSGELRGMTSNVVARLAGLPPEVSHVTMNRQCGSGMQAMHLIAQSIMIGNAECGLAVGVERMGRNILAAGGENNPIQSVNPALGKLSDAQKRADPKHNEYYTRLFDQYIIDSPPNVSMPQTAQNIAEIWGITRADLDAFSALSHQNAIAAYEAGRYRDQVLPLSIRQPVFDADGNPDYTQQGPEMRFERDECIRADTSIEKLATLKPLPGVVSYDQRELVITAGNSCPTNDGASAILLMSEDKAKALGLTPLARIASMAVAGVKPQLMGIGTIPASKKALQRAGISARDIGLSELNEAFAAQCIATIRDVGLDPATVNVNGGSVAIGHPLGASGIRLIGQLGHEMRRRGNVRYGLATMCIGAGMGIATVIEAMN